MYKDILLPIDLSDEKSWKGALPIAVEEAKAHGATLHVMTCVPTYGMAVVSQYFPADHEEKMLQEATRLLHELVQREVAGKVPVQHIVAHGTVYREILKSAKEVGADLIIMHTDRPDVHDYLIGSNASKVVQHATQSVLVVRG